MRGWPWAEVAEGLDLQFLKESMFKDKSPGVKILWLWAIGTAAILVTNVARTRLRDMEKLMNTEVESTGKSVVIDSSPGTHELVGE
ncbi:hypothetical protein U1Q18_026371 [Sarracenia purpurea var. burkii]